MENTEDLVVTSNAINYLKNYKPVIANDFVGYVVPIKLIVKWASRNSFLAIRKDGKLIFYSISKLRKVLKTYTIQRYVKYLCKFNFLMFTTEDPFPGYSSQHNIPMDLNNANLIEGNLFEKIL